MSALISVFSVSGSDCVICASVSIEGVVVSAVETVDGVAAVMGRSRGSAVGLCTGAVGAVVLRSGLVTFTTVPVGLVDSYSVGGWTSAYRACFVSLHLREVKTLCER